MAQLSKADALRNCCCDCTHLNDLYSLLHHPVQHLKQLNGGLLPVHGETLSDLRFNISKINK